MATLSKKGALAVTKDLDRLATVIATAHDSFGIPLRIAETFARQCDLLADRIEKTAGIEPQSKTGYDAGEIGEEKPGPQENPSTPEIKDHFTQKENNELRETEGGTVQAAATALSLVAGELSKAANSFAKTNRPMAGALTRLAGAVLLKQGGVLQGTTSLAKAATVYQAATAVVGHVATVTENDVAKFAKVAGLAIRVAESEDEEPEATPEDKPEGEDKKAFSHGYDLDG